MIVKKHKRGVISKGDPHWIGEGSKIKRTETPYTYVNVVYTDVYVNYLREILINLIIFFNSREMQQMQHKKKCLVLNEITRLKKELNKFENYK